MSRYLVDLFARHTYKILRNQFPDSSRFMKLFCLQARQSLVQDSHRIALLKTVSNVTWKFLNLLKQNDESKIVKLLSRWRLHLFRLLSLVCKYICKQSYVKYRYSQLCNHTREIHIKSCWRLCDVHIIKKNCQNN